MNQWRSGNACLRRMGALQNAPLPGCPCVSIVVCSRAEAMRQMRVASKAWRPRKVRPYSRRRWECRRSSSHSALLWAPPGCGGDQSSAKENTADAGVSSRHGPAS
eukprot:10271307-Lingulodinium_polyedra.AAC.1